MVMRVLLLFVVLACVLWACGEAPGQDGDSAALEGPATVIADEPTLPDAEADEYVGVAITVEQRDAQWPRFGLTGSALSVDFSDRVLLFVGFGESSSCPYIFDGIEVEGQVLRLLNAAEYQECTDDYNGRTLVVSIDREVLPDGFITVDMPAEADDAVISVVESAEPAPAAPNPVDTSVTDVSLTVEPQPASVGDDVTVRIANATEQDRVATPRWVTVERWTGHHFERVGEIDPGGDLVEVGPEDTVELLTFSTADEAFQAGPGWYQLTASVEVRTGGYGRLDARGNLHLVEGDRG